MATTTVPPETEMEQIRVFAPGELDRLFADDAPAAGHCPRCGGGYKCPCTHCQACKETYGQCACPKGEVDGLFVPVARGGDPVVNVEAVVCPTCGRLPCGCMSGPPVDRSDLVQAWHDAQHSARYDDAEDLVTQTKDAIRTAALPGLTVLDGDGYDQLLDTDGDPGTPIAWGRPPVLTITDHDGSQLTVQRSNDLHRVAIADHNGAVYLADTALDALAEHLLHRGTELDALDRHIQALRTLAIRHGGGGSNLRAAVEHLVDELRDRRTPAPSTGGRVA